MKRFLSAASILAAVYASSGHSAEPRFLDNLSGNWSGSGKAYLKNLGNIPASCKMEAAGANTVVNLKGRCGVFLFRIGLGLELRDEGGNQFSGVYTGSGTGPAKLDGILDGNKLHMNITWNGDVNGDRTAKMILERVGPNSFTQTVTDKVRGKAITTSKFVFTRG